MEKTDKRYQAYIDILREELIPAMGCTEPIAVAYAAAAARNTLGELPDKVLVEASGSMIKNVKSVIAIEEIGLIPWQFHLPDEAYASAFERLKDEKCFKAPYGPTTADQSHPRVP
mgnify:CR=1 FL=1